MAEKRVVHETLQDIRARSQLSPFAELKASPKPVKLLSAWRAAPAQSSAFRAVGMSFGAMFWRLNFSIAREARHKSAKRSATPPWHVHAKQGSGMDRTPTKSISPTQGALLALLLFFCPLAMSGQSVKLMWNPSSSPSVVGYIVYYGTDGTNFDDQLDAGSNTFATVTGLEPGSTNYFEVVAYDVNHIQKPALQPDPIQRPSLGPYFTLALQADPTNAGSVTGGGSFAQGTRSR